jgi:phage terminase large subunit
LGEFTKLEGVVFRTWDIVKVVPPEVLPESLGVGLDFGFGGDPAAALRVWIRERSREIWIRQLVYKTDLYNDMLYSELVDNGVRPYEDVTADSARPDIIGDLYRMGLNGIKGVKKYAGYKEDIAMRLQGYTIHVTEDSTDAIKELSTYSWARDKNGKQLPKLQDGDDHLVDCLVMVMAANTGERSILDVI